MRIDTSKIDTVLIRLKRKDAALFKAVQKKIIQIASLDESAIEHFKDLRHDMNGFKRVHACHFVFS